MEIIMKLFKTSEYHEDYNDCLFFHFHSFEEPPEVEVTSPLYDDFDYEYWTHFVKIDFMNDIFEQAMNMGKE
jgi:hypothetical protein